MNGVEFFLLDISFIYAKDILLNEFPRDLWLELLFADDRFLEKLPLAPFNAAPFVPYSYCDWYTDTELSCTPLPCPANPKYVWLMDSISSFSSFISCILLYISTIFLSLSTSSCISVLLFSSLSSWATTLLFFSKSTSPFSLYISFRLLLFRSLYATVILLSWLLRSATWRRRALVVSLELEPSSMNFWSFCQ